MGECVKHIIRTLCHGSSSFSLNTRHDYDAHIPHSAASLAAANWTRVGEQLRKSMNEVITKNV